MGKSTSHIILFLIPALGKLLKLRQNQVIAAVSSSERPHEIMYLPAAVDAEHDICHLFVAEFHDFII